ncbi:MAG: hypothetical protein WAN87_09115 [Thermoplasmata archaeon]
MTTVRLNEIQRRRLEAGRRLLEGAEGRKLTQGEAIAEMAQFALRHREILAETPFAASADLETDPLLDMTLTIDMGRTSPHTVDRLLYGKR